MLFITVAVRAPWRPAVFPFIEPQLFGGGVHRIKVVNATVPPGITDFDSGVATGAAGKATVGVIVALVSWPVVSATTYFTGVATPAKVGNGLNVTVPFAFTV